MNRSVSAVRAECQHEGARHGPAPGGVLPVAGTALLAAQGIRATTQASSLRPPESRLHRPGDPIGLFLQPDADLPGGDRNRASAL